MIILFIFLAPNQGYACASRMENIKKDIAVISIEQIKYGGIQVIDFYIKAPLTYDGWAIQRISIERDDAPYLAIPLMLKHGRDEVRASGGLAKHLLKGARVHIAYGRPKCIQAFKYIQLNKIKITLI